MSWVRSANGPEFWDIAHLLAEIEKTHRCTVYVLLMHDGAKGSANVRFICTAQRDGQLSTELYDPVSTETKFPNPYHKTPEGAIWEALFRLEGACTRAWWVQQKMWS